MTHDGCLTQISGTSGTMDYTPLKLIPFGHFEQTLWKNGILRGPFTFQTCSDKGFRDSSRKYTFLPRFHFICIVFKCFDFLKKRNLWGIAVLPYTPFFIRIIFIRIARLRFDNIFFSKVTKIPSNE